MRIVITGTPGTGKTTLAKNLSKELGYSFFNEKDFALKNGLGSFNDSDELEIPLKDFEIKANNFFSKNKGIILEGHLLCEMKLSADVVILLRLHPEELEERLKNRSYYDEKVMDNVFCEGIDYCKKHVLKNYPSEKIFEISSQSNPKETLKKVVSKLSSLEKTID